MYDICNMGLPMYALFEQIFEKSIPSERNKLKHKTPSTHLRTYFFVLQLNFITAYATCVPLNCRHAVRFFLSTRGVSSQNPLLITSPHIGVSRLTKTPAHRGGIPYHDVFPSLHTAGVDEIWIDQSGFSRREKLYCLGFNGKFTGKELNSGNFCYWRCH